MSTNDPDQIRAEIERTRNELSTNVNALGEAVTPGNIARRQGEKVKGTMVGLKDKVMGVDDPTSPDLSDRASDLADRASHAADDAKAQVRGRTQGNPLAAGLVALGAGWLLGSLLPASKAEQRAATAVKEKAEPLVEEAKSVAQDAAEHLKEPAQQAADSVTQSAKDAAQNVKDDAQSNAQSVKDHAQDASDTVKEHQQRPDTSV